MNDEHARRARLARPRWGEGHAKRDDSAAVPPLAILLTVVIVMALLAVFVLLPLLTNAVPVNPCPPGVCGTGGSPPVGVPFTISTPISFTIGQFSFTMSVGPPTGRLNVSAPPPSGSLATNIVLWGSVTITFPNSVQSIYPAGSISSPWVTVTSGTSVSSFPFWQNGPHGAYTVTVSISARWQGCQYPSTQLSCAIVTGIGTGTFTI